MPERIYKLQPDRTLHLRGFDGFGAAAALHSATKDSFKVSGVFRDAADFAVLMLYDADNFYDHPSIRYLPDFDFDGLSLSFDVHYSGLMTLDSPRYPTIDWAWLDYAPESGIPQRYCRLSDCATYAGGTYTKAQAQFTILDNGMLQGDKLELWYLNNVFEYEVPGRVSCSYQFFACGVDTSHTVTVNGRDFAYVEQPGDGSATIALRLCQALQSSPDVFASVGDGTPENGPAHQLNIKPRLDDGTSTVTVTSSVYPTPMVLGAVGPVTVAQQLAKTINEYPWAERHIDVPLDAESDGPVITVRPRYAGVDGNFITMYATSASERLTVAENWVRFAGGVSDTTWHVEIPFDSRSVRQLWLTFSPALPCGEEMEPAEWEATFTNWELAEATEEERRLLVAGPGSVRIDDDDPRCRFSKDHAGVSEWGPEAGFYSRGFAQCSNKLNATVTVPYQCDSVHDLYLGTSLYVDRGSVRVEVDGQFVQDVSFALVTADKPEHEGPAVITRRKIASGIAAGRHTLTLTHLDIKPVYFDFLDAVVPTDVPDALAPRTNVSPALDYSTDHTFKLSPQRLLWNFDQLGFAGPMNEYMGVFWWNQRVRSGGKIPSVTVHFDGTFEPQPGLDCGVFLQFGDQKIGKSVLLLTETPSTIARHFEALINATLVGLWAKADGPDLTITARSYSSAYSFPFNAWVENSSGTVEYGEQGLTGGAEPDWVIDPGITPVLNRGARAWHADFFRECAQRNRQLVVAGSMELVNPPDEFKALYPDRIHMPQTSVGFGSLNSSHCAFNAPMLAYQKRVFSEIAALMAEAGLTPSVQFGEFCWWYFPYPGGGMAFYDADTLSAARAALGGQELFEFQWPDQNPSDAPAHALFLRNRLRDHVAALAAEVRGKYPNACIEVLFPYDVNYPKVVGMHALGGRLLRYLNFPAEWEHKQTSGLDTIKMEGLDFGAWTHNLDLATDVMRFPLDLGWPLDSVRYLIPVFKSGAPWDTEYRLAKSLGIPVINFWAFDHFSLFALDVLQGENTGRAVRV